MPDPNPIAELQRRLLELGCPVKAARRIVRETAEHLKDLQKAALGQGLPASAALQRATEQLGEPQTLARRHVDALRNSSWWGRHPGLGFGVFPAAAMLGLAFLFWYLGGNRFAWNDPWDLLRDHAVWAFLWMGWLYWASLLAVTALLAFCLGRRARRLAVPRCWIWVAGGVLAAHGLFVQVQPSHWAALVHGEVLKTEKIAPPGKPFMMETALHGADEAGPVRLTKEYDFEDCDVLQLVPLRTALPPDFAVVHDPALQNHITAGLAGIRESLMQHPLTSLGKLGWGPSWHMLSNYEPPGKPSMTTITAYSDASGQLRWEAYVEVNFPCYAIGYSPAIFNGGLLHWLNVVLPLLIVAATLAWQKRKSRGLQEELAGTNHVTA